MTTTDAPTGQPHPPLVAPPEHTPVSITEREEDFIWHLSIGDNYQQLAPELGMSAAQAKAFGGLLQHKVGAKTCAHLVALWIWGKLYCNRSKEHRNR